MYHTEDAEVIAGRIRHCFASVAFRRDEALRKQGLKAGLFRPITLWPFPSKDWRGGGLRAKRSWSSN